MKKKDLEDMWAFNTMSLSDKVKSQILTPSGRGGVYAARDYVAANALLSEYRKVVGDTVDMPAITDQSEIWSTLHPATRFRLKMYTPCLCERYDGLKPAEQKQVFDSTDWVCFSKGTRVQMADGTSRKIEDVKVGEFVLGWNGLKIVPTKVIHTNVTKDKHRVWSVYRDGKVVCATKDHKWFDGNDWVETQNLNKVAVKSLSDTAYKMLLGTILGDASVGKDGNLTLSQSVDHEEYVKYLMRVFGCAFSNLSLQKHNNGKLSVKTTSAGHKFRNLRDEFYPEGVKVIPEIAVKNFSAPLFATWFMDDGTLMKSNTVNPNARLLLHQFSDDSVNLVSEFLKSQGFKNRVLLYEEPFRQRIISFDWESSIKFLDWIEPWICQCMSYKTLGKYGNFEEESEIEVVNNVRTKVCNHGAVHTYCISTELESFVLANGDVVHNCSEKQNGCRGVLIVYNGETHLYSRNYSDKDCGLLEYWNNIDQTTNLPQGIYAIDCFAGDTRITMADGSLKRIKEIIPGEYVKTFNEKTKQVEAKKVLSVIDKGLLSKERWCVVKPHFETEEKFRKRGAGTHGFRSITCTTDHKFYVNGSWVPANKLSSVSALNKKMSWVEGLDDFIEVQSFAEDSLQTLSTSVGECKQLRGNHVNMRAWDLEIEDNHNFFAENILVHNCEIKFEPGADISQDLENLGLTTDSPLEAMVALLHTYPEEAVKIQRKYKNIYGQDLIVFRLIHPLYFQGKNYLKRVLGEGIDVYDACVEAGRAIGLNVKPTKRCVGTREEKEIFLNSIINAGGEGVVFWNRKGNYVTSENRSKTSWIKLKRTITDTESGKGLGDTIDAYITGFKVGSNGTANEGLIAAIECSVFVNDNGKIYEHHIASIPNIEKNYKELMTVNDASGLWPQEIVLSDGTTKWISMNPEFDHLVVECTGQALSSKSLRLEHPRMIMFRPERDPNSCVYTKEWLTANATNQGISYKQND